MIFEAAVLPLVVPLLLAMFLAVNMGGSGTAPAFSAAYGADLIRRDLIPGLFGLFVFAGALLAGQQVAATLGKDIVPEARLDVVVVSIILASIALSMLLANLLSVPQSTSQATVLALAGVAWHFDVLASDRLWLEIAPVWFALPVAAFAITWLLAKLGVIGKRASETPQQGWRRKLLRFAVLGGACYVAFAIGSNNVANASGPLAVMLGQTLGLGSGTEGAALLLLLTTLIVAPCFGIGSSIFGRAVMHTTGKQLVELGPRAATLVALVTASLLLTASLTRGIPVSLVQMNTAAILALALREHGARKLWNGKALRRILSVWLVAPVLSFGLAFGLCGLAGYLGFIA